MKILQDLNLHVDLADTHLFLDTNIFIAALNYPYYLNFLYKLKSTGCDFMTIMPVLLEFTRGSSSLSNFEKRFHFIKELACIYPIERNLEELKEGMVVIQTIMGKMDYVDFLLTLCSYKFRLSKLDSCYLLTENHNHYPLDILDRVHLITIDSGKQIRTHATYRLNIDKLNKAAENILKQK